MHFPYISDKGIFYVNSTTKYVVIYIAGHQRLENKTFFPGSLDTKMLV